MRSLKILLPLLIAVASVIVFTVHSNADGIVSGSSAGTADDPVVTKSYVDEQIKRYLGNGAPTNTVDAGSPGKTGSSTEQTATEPKTTDSTVTVVQLKPGQTLYGGAGAEFVVRTGKAVAVTTDENGIVDATSGKDIPDGTPVELNHLLLFPRDGRGIKPDAKQKSDIFVMVKGNYLLLNADGSKATP